LSACPLDCTLSEVEYHSQGMVNCHVTSKYVCPEHLRADTVDIANL